MKVVVAELSDFADGDRRIVKAGGREIGVFRIGDDFFAVRNRCPHQGGPLCVGPVERAFTADAPGEAHPTDGSPFVACPWHGWEYDLATGQSYVGPSDPGVRSYPVSVEPGAAVADAKVEPGRRIPGPYVVETFPVQVEEEYVVLEL